MSATNILLACEQQHHQIDMDRVRRQHAAELERLQGVIAQYRATILDQIKRIDSLRQDAERYRFLRNYRPGLLLDMIDDAQPVPEPQWAVALDAAIDLAISRGMDNE